MSVLNLFGPLADRRRSGSSAAVAKLLPHGFLYSCSLLSHGLSAETEIREVGRGLSLADTQTGRYGRLHSRRRLCAKHSSRRTALHSILAWPPSRCSRNIQGFQNTIVLITRSLVLIPVPVSRANAYSGGVLAKALPEVLRYLSTWAWLRSDTPPRSKERTWETDRLT